MGFRPVYISVMSIAIEISVPRYNRCSFRGFELYHSYHNVGDHDTRLYGGREPFLTQTQ